MSLLNLSTIDNDKDKSMMHSFKNEKEFIMYYHTAIRNVGLFTSISLAGLGASKAFLKEHDGQIRLGYIFLFALVLVFLSMSLIISSTLVQHIADMKAKNKNFYIEPQYEYVPMGALFINFIGFLIGSYSLLKSLYIFFFVK